MTTRSEIDRLMQIIHEAAPSAKADPNRPRYHLLPPASWMNDPNGGIFHNGWYHLFYLHSPDQDHPFENGPPWLTKVWSHARSQDLVHWEHLPIALVPPDPSYRCMSGSIFIRADGRPMIFFSYSTIEPGPISQWAAVGNDDLLTWDILTNQPVLDFAAHDGPTFKCDWRDPFVFEAEGRVFMILGAVWNDQSSLEKTFRELRI